ncbi:hypothetical protein CD30_05520 [Ureibacillus massiliensis 4400831 = CIP 108448 = CCUG 49529]|uniref:Uncharacterized protein n=1 Tax=Ureibacillus massiliensis 4400831 = CIP 108448 = CCUG 49529 TaxID=1211035 RepID=A0A0A3J6Z6_9BACL|nr:hypothetical protein [Ureibacillus massiliensis]KGR91515.1 hypothetical protein CD30_05520 [Ureibacillus massiliensis 4400831 = CIP 108448 = CCUG 49529]
MDFSIILMIIGIVCVVVSFFLKDSSKKIEKDLEELSISIYQETNSLKRRLKVVEEELLLEPNFQVKSPLPNKTKSSINQSFQLKQTEAAPAKNVKPINEILVRQVIELKKQGYTLQEMIKMSPLSEEQIRYILTNNGGIQ